jgi:hypothetical protein
MPAPTNGTLPLLAGAPNTAVSAQTPALLSPRLCSLGAASDSIGSRVLITLRWSLSVWNVPLKLWRRVGARGMMMGLRRLLRRLLLPRHLLLLRRLLLLLRRLLLLLRRLRLLLRLTLPLSLLPSLPLLWPSLHLLKPIPPLSSHLLKPTPPLPPSHPLHTHPPPPWHLLHRLPLPPPPSHQPPHLHLPPPPRKMQHAMSSMFTSTIFRAVSSFRILMLGFTSLVDGSSSLLPWMICIASLFFALLYFVAGCCGFRW